jgi:AcrR family transcriptional regulator
MDATLHDHTGHGAARERGVSVATKLRRRLPRKEREKLIIAEAVKFFAEVGFEGQTRALAQRLGVTQPLLYRYFPDKESLIDRVYREVFVDSWDARWNVALCDRRQPLLDRVLGFYRAYTKANFSYERVRLFMFAGLKDESIASRYMTHVRDQLFLPLCREIRAEAGLATDTAVSAEEVELVAGLHGAVGYVGLRRWVFQSEMPEDLDRVITQLVGTYLGGLPDAFRKIAKAA